MNRNFDINDIIRQVLEFMSSVGIEPDNPDDIFISNGLLRRFRTTDDKPNEKSGAYCIYTDGWPAGFVQDWRKGIKEYWKYDISGLDNEQRSYFNSDEYRKQCEKKERETRERRAREQAEASKKACQLWERLPEAPKNHPYLLRKNIIWLNSTCLRYNPKTKCLAIPLMDINGRVMSIQWIQENGQKFFFEGTSMHGIFWECWLEGAMKKDPKGIILLGEGFATMTKIFTLMIDKPVVAAMSCHKLTEIARILREKYPEAKIIITADNDHQTERKRKDNPGLKYAKLARKTPYKDKFLVDGVIYPEFKPDEDGSDWDDYAAIHGNDITGVKLNEDITRALIPSNIRNMMDKGRLCMIGAQELRSKVFQPVKWAVPGFLPSGLSILGAPPKTGKSILALQISLGVAIGGYVLGKIQVEKGDVLYLALEDNERRLQERIESSNNIDEHDDLSRLTFVYTIPRQHEGGLEFIEWWLQTHPEARLVIIDTLQKFRKQLSNKANVYAEDYDVISEIKKVADRYDVAFLIIHHLKKVKPKDELTMDWIDSFSGSAGISGSADALFVLKRARQSKNGKLFRTGRDVEEKEFWLELDGFGWSLEGEAEKFTLPEWQRQIVDFLKEHPTVVPIELAQFYNINVNTARSNLQRMCKEGKLEKTGRAQYVLKA